MKNKLFKRIMSLVLVVVMAVSTMAISAVSTSAATTEYTYRLTIETGDKDYAGTDRNIYLHAYNENGKFIKKINLDTPGNSFERDDTDVVTITLTEKLGSIKLELEGYDGWYVDYVKIEELSGDKVVKTRMCYYYRWFNDSDIFPPSNIMIPPENSYTYRITVKTGNASYAGTDNYVYLTGYNADGKKIKQMIIADAGDDFEKGDTFVKNYTFSQKVENISVSLDDSFIFDDWQLEYVKLELLCRSSSNEVLESKIYHYDKWISACSHALKYENNPERRHEFTTTDIENVNVPKSYLYTLTIKTGSKFGAGTDSYIYFNAYNADGKQIGNKIKLDTYGNSFENGDTDVILVSLPEKMDHFTITVDHRTAIKDKWYLEYISVIGSSYCNIFRDQTYSFNKWMG